MFKYFVSAALATLVVFCYANTEDIERSIVLDRSNKTSSTPEMTTQKMGTTVVFYPDVSVTNSVNGWVANGFIAYWGCSDDDFKNLEHKETFTAWRGECLITEVGAVLYRGSQSKVATSYTSSGTSYSQYHIVLNKNGNAEVQRITSLADNSFVTPPNSNISTMYPNTRIRNTVYGWTASGVISYSWCGSGYYQDLEFANIYTEGRGGCLITEITAEMKAGNELITASPYTSSGTSYSQFEIIQKGDRTFQVRRIGTNKVISNANTSGLTNQKISKTTNDIMKSKFRLTNTATSWIANGTIQCKEGHSIHYTNLLPSKSFHTVQNHCVIASVTANMEMKGQTISAVPYFVSGKDEKEFYIIEQTNGTFVIGPSIETEYNEVTGLMLIPKDPKCETGLVQSLIFQKNFVTVITVDKKQYYVLIKDIQTALLNAFLVSKTFTFYSPCCAETNPKDCEITAYQMDAWT